MPLYVFCDCKILIWHTLSCKTILYFVWEVQYGRKVDSERYTEYAHTVNHGSGSIMLEDVGWVELEKGLEAKLVRGLESLGTWKNSQSSNRTV